VPPPGPLVPTRATKLAVIDLDWLIVTTQVLEVDAAQAPLGELQEPKEKPAAGVAVNVTTDPFW